MPVQEYNLSSCPQGQLYDRLRDIDLAVIGAARYFCLNEEPIDKFLATLPQKAPAELLDERHHLIDTGSIERTLNFLFCLESINFGGPFSSALKKEGFAEDDDSLYVTSAGRLKAFFNANGTFSARKMAEIEPPEVAVILALDLSMPVSNRMAHMYAESLNETGRHVDVHYGGSFSSFLESSHGSVEMFVRQMWQLPKFRDVHNYSMPDGTSITVPILKRAQHIVGSIDLAMQRLGGGRPFNDLEKLTAFPDNKISHVMMVENILVPYPATRGKIEKGEAFPAGSAEEVENRVFGRHIVRLMSQRSGIMQVDLDHRIWEHSHGRSFARDADYKDVPQMRTQEPTFNY